MSGIDIWTIYKDDTPIKTFNTEDAMLRYALEIGAIQRFMKKSIVHYSPNFRYSFGYEYVEDRNASNG